MVEAIEYAYYAYAYYLRQGKVERSVFNVAPRRHRDLARPNGCQIRVQQPRNILEITHKQLTHTDTHHAMHVP